MHKIPLISWTKMELSKLNGGLGFMNLADQAEANCARWISYTFKNPKSNVALMLKQLWWGKLRNKLEIKKPSTHYRML